MYSTFVFLKKSIKKLVPAKVSESPQSLFAYISNKKYMTIVASPNTPSYN